MAGEKTWADCIDIDSHDVIGWYGLPTQFDPNGERGYGSDDVRFLPIVELPLAHFLKLKRFYDAFPDRIWAFSSANLGMALWKVYRWPRLVTDRYAAVQRQLVLAGLGGTEVYPQPAKTKGSLGKCHRRPCGMDSAIITDRGLVTDPIEQVRLFMHPPATPSFAVICGTILDVLADMYESWLKWPGYDIYNTIPQNQRPQKLAELAKRLEQVRDWVHRGFPVDKIVVPLSSPASTARVTKQSRKPRQRSQPPRQPPNPLPAMSNTQIISTRPT